MDIRVGMDIMVSTDIMVCMDRMGLYGDKGLGMLKS